MKILKIKVLSEAKELDHNHWLKRIIIILVGTIVFLGILGILHHYTTPFKYSERNIDQKFAIVESEGGTYLGPLLDGYYQGNGEFRHLSGGIYDGAFTKSKREGDGTFHFANGDTYSGTWKNDQMQEGTYTFADGREYKGTFQNNKFYSGTFSLGNSAATRGFAFFTADINGGIISSVSFQQNDGIHYNGQVNGYAEITYADGNIYTGNVKNGVRDGKGTFKWMSGTTELASYNGEWKQGMMQGVGTYYYTAQEYPYVQGNFEDGKLNGDAQYYKKSGKMFKTKWQNGICLANDVK